jgi:hypothetical protein
VEFVSTDQSRELPEEWTDDLCVKLFYHARELGHYGNPGGYMLTVQLFPFVGKTFATEAGTERGLRPYDDWDYDGMRAWIADNLEEVKISWQRHVVFA